MEGVPDAISFIYDIRSKGYSADYIGDNVSCYWYGHDRHRYRYRPKELGAKNVTLVYRRTKLQNPVLMWNWIIAKLDGCEIIWLAAPKEVKGENGKVKEFVCSIMTLGEPDASGRRSPVDTGETFTLDVDMVIKAAGQIPFEGFVNDNKLDNKNGNLDHR